MGVMRGMCWEERAGGRRRRRSRYQKAQVRALVLVHGPVFPARYRDRRRTENETGRRVVHVHRPPEDERGDETW